MLAISGFEATHNAVKNFLASDNIEKDGTWWDTYLTMLAHAPSVDLTVVEDVLVQYD